MALFSPDVCKPPESEVESVPRGMQSFQQGHKGLVGNEGLFISREAPMACHSTHGSSSIEAHPAQPNCEMQRKARFCSRIKEPLTTFLQLTNQLQKRERFVIDPVAAGGAKLLMISSMRDWL